MEKGAGSSRKKHELREPKGTVDTVLPDTDLSRRGLARSSNQLLRAEDGDGDEEWRERTAREESVDLDVDVDVDVDVVVDVVVDEVDVDEVKSRR
ncbi:hypothetical protein A7C99_0184 [Trichophyton rubrum]|nr:hypothetical protein A7C99_0184 [Trichophyton rubrum]